jgi:hypothetical protein
MTRRAILWCGYVKPPLPRPGSEASSWWSDAAASINDLEIAFRGARALGVPLHEIYACVCTPEVLPQAFETRERPASVAALRSLTAEIARHAGPEDALLFVATNHGDERRLFVPEKRDVRGLVTEPSVEELDERSLRDDDLDDPDEQSSTDLLTPETFAACFDPLPGAQVVVVAACHAGCFLGIGNQRRMVLTSCGADEKYWVDQEESSCSAFIAELFAAWCAVAPRDDIPADNMAPDEAFARSVRRLADAGARTVPRRQGSTVWNRG